jgi:membrane fusion protein, copper/silver efflux system
MKEMPEAGAARPGDIHKGEGKVEDIGQDEIVLSHGPIPSMKWGPMTMGFRLPADRLPKDLRVGDNVTFEMRQGKDGTFEITQISPMATGARK